MPRSRNVWYALLARSGFLLLPCGFNSPHSHTEWLFDYQKQQHAVPWLSTPEFQVAHTHITCFFYQLNAALLKQFVPFMQLTSLLLRNQLAAAGVALALPELARADWPPTCARFAGKPALQGFGLPEYLLLLSVIAAELDPMERAPDPERWRQYLAEFDAYGLCCLSVTRVQAG